MQLFAIFLLCAVVTAQLECVGTTTLTKPAGVLTSIKLSSGDDITIVETTHTKTAGATQLALSVAAITDEPVSELVSDEINGAEWRVAFTGNSAANSDNDFSGALRHTTSLLVAAMVTVSVFTKMSKRAFVFLLALVALSHVLFAACANTVVVAVTTPTGWSKTSSGSVVTFTKDSTTDSTTFTCTCENGVAAEGSDCTSNTVMCNTCDAGYSGATCVANTCTCENGVGATGSACPSQGAAKCTSCNANFEISNDACVASSSCTCGNGVAATGSACTGTGEKCTSCDNGFKLSGDACVATSCTCTNGQAASGAACLADGEKCTSCDNGFKLSGDACVATSCTCSNGKEATGAACLADGVKCVSCDDNYVLSGSACVMMTCSTPTSTTGYKLTETTLTKTGFDVTAECNTVKGYAGSAKVTACTSVGPYSVEGCAAITCGEDQYVFDHACLNCAKGTFRAAGDKATGSNTVCVPKTCGTKQYVNTYECKDCPAGTDFSKHTGLHKTNGGNTQCDSSKCNTGEYGTGSGCATCAVGYTNKAGDLATSVTTCDPVMCPIDHRVRSNKCEPCPNGQVYSANADASKGDTECVAKSTQKTCAELAAIEPKMTIRFYSQGATWNGQSTCGVRAFRHTLVDPNEFVCTGADNPSTRASQGIKYAVDLQDWNEANSFCQGRSMRLCTDAETPDTARHSGCGFDGNIMWTSTKCTAKDGTAGHLVSGGTSSSTILAKIQKHAMIGPSRCVSDKLSYVQLKEMISVQCCSDKVLP